MVFEGSKSREVDALLSLEPGNLIVRSKSDGAVLRTVPYRAIAAATYTRGRKPRGQTLPGASNIPDDVGGQLPALSPWRRTDRQAATETA